MSCAHSSSHSDLRTTVDEPHRRRQKTKTRRREEIEGLRASYAVYYAGLGITGWEPWFEGMLRSQGLSDDSEPATEERAAVPEADDMSWLYQCLGGFRPWMDKQQRRAHRRATYTAHFRLLGLTEGVAEWETLLANTFRTLDELEADEDEEERNMYRVFHDGQPGDKGEWLVEVDDIAFPCSINTVEVSRLVYAAREGREPPIPRPVPQYTPETDPLPMVPRVLELTGPGDLALDEDFRPLVYPQVQVQWV